MKWFVKLALVYCCIFAFASSAFAATQYYYLRASGAGSNFGDTGTWAVMPTTDANAMSVSSFNDPNNWSTSENPNKIDPDDVVYIKGTWGSANESIIPRGGCTLDFYEPGDYDPETMSHTIEPVLNRPMYINVDNVTVQDGRFVDWGNRSIVVGAERFGKVRYCKILRNHS